MEEEKVLNVTQLQVVDKLKNEDVILLIRDTGDAKQCFQIKGFDFRGESAYEAALSQGFEGTYADWQAEIGKTIQVSAAVDAATKATIDAETATGNANRATTRATDAATGAEMVNVTLDNDILNVTDRTGAKKQLELITNAKAVEIEKKVSDLSSSKIDNQDSVLLGYGVNDKGVLPDKDFTLSPMIPVPEGCTSLTWSTGGVLDTSVYSQRGCYLTEYDVEKNHISDGFWFPNREVRNIPLNENTKYLRFPVLNKNIGGAYVENDEFNLFWSFSYNKKFDKLSDLSSDTFTFGYGLSILGKAVKDKDFILSPMIEIPEDCTSFDWHIGTSLDDKKYQNAFLCEFDENKMFVDGWFSKSGSTATSRVVTLNAKTKYVRFPIFNSNIGDSWIENKEYNLYCGFDTQKVKENNYYDDTYYCLRNLNKTKIDENIGSSDTSYKPLVLLHFADIHNDDVNLQRVVDFSNKYNNNLDDVFLNGDIAGGEWNDYSDALNKVLINNKILCSIGNHDTYKYNGTESQATKKQCYDRYFANIANWGVTEPNANSDVGNCYYYKDYPSSGIRFIVLDCMHYDTEQNNWLKATLADALSSKKSVIAAQHIAVANPSSTEVTIPYDTPFNSIDHKDDSTSDNGQVTAIEDFINNGGEFITWLFGHTHSSFCGKLKVKKQNYIIVGGAKFDVNWNDTVRNPDDYSRDLFDVMSFDTKSKTISVKRIGANYDRFMRKRNAMCIDYANFKLLSTN